MPTDAEIARAYTDRALRLIRVGNRLSADAGESLSSLSGDLRRILAGHDLSSLTRRNLRGLLRDIDDAIAARIAPMAEAQITAARDLVQIEAGFARTVSRLPRAASDARIASVVDGIALFGVPLAEVWRRWRDGFHTRITGSVRQGAAGAMPADAAIGAILGAPIGRRASGVLAGAARAASALAHTAVAEAAQAARIAAWRANGVNAFRFHAVLDTKTTPGCALRHGKLYDIETLAPIGHNIPIERRPPRHWNCRSILLPMAYADDIPMPPDGGAGEFRDYFDGLSAKEQDDLFGVGRADLFRRGVITQRDLVAQDGRMLTLDELRAAHP